MSKHAKYASRPPRVESQERIEPSSRSRACISRTSALNFTKCTLRDRTETRRSPRLIADLATRARTVPGRFIIALVKPSQVSIRQEPGNIVVPRRSADPKNMSIKFTCTGSSIRRGGLKDPWKFREGWAARKIQGETRCFQLSSWKTDRCCWAVMKNRLAITGKPIVKI